MCRGVLGLDSFKGWLIGIGIIVVGFLVGELLLFFVFGVGLVVLGVCIVGFVVGCWFNRKGCLWLIVIYD